MSPSHYEEALARLALIEKMRAELYEYAQALWGNSGILLSAADLHHALSCLNDAAGDLFFHEKEEAQRSKDLWERAKRQAALCEWATY